ATPSTAMTNRQQAPIERARQAEQWKAQAEEWLSQPSFLDLAPMELIALAENTNVGRRRTGGTGGSVALDVWREAGADRGMPRTAAAGSTAEANGAAPEPEPKDDDPASGWKAAAKMAGVHVSMLRRELLAGRFALPQRISVRRRRWTAG